LHQDWISRNRTHAGIVVAPQHRYSVGEEMRRLMRLISHRTAEEMLGRLEFISGWA